MLRRGKRPTEGKPQSELLLKQYETQTARELGEAYGVSEGTIRRWIREARDEKKGEG